MSLRGGQSTVGNIIERIHFVFAVPTDIDSKFMVQSTTFADHVPFFDCDSALSLQRVSTSQVNRNVTNSQCNRAVLLDRRKSRCQTGDDQL